MTSSCYDAASHASCDAMSELAVQEWRADHQRMSRLFDDEGCRRFQSLADRDLESRIQKGFGLSKNACFTKTNQFNAGPWEKQVMDVQLPTFYDKWTRARNNGKQTCGPRRKYASRDRRSTHASGDIMVLRNAAPVASH